MVHMLFAHASLPVRDACLGVSWLRSVHCVLAAESSSLGCFCLMTIEQVAVLLGFPAISVPGFGLQFAGTLYRRWPLILCQTP